MSHKGCLQAQGAPFPAWLSPFHVAMVRQPQGLSSTFQAGAWGHCRALACCFPRRFNGAVGSTSHVPWEGCPRAFNLRTLLQPRPAPSSAWCAQAGGRFLTGGLSKLILGGVGGDLLRSPNLALSLSLESCRCHGSKMGHDIGPVDFSLWLADRLLVKHSARPTEQTVGQTAPPSGTLKVPPELPWDPCHS